jgi:integrase
VLEGSIRRAGNRVRITAQLIDAANGAHLWADRYDRDLTDIFAVQDDVTRRIVDTLKVTLSRAERTRLTDSGTPNIDAYDCYLRGREILALNPKNRGRFEQSTKLFMRALELDRSYSQAYAALSMAYNLDYQNRWSDDPDNSLLLAKHNAEQAIEKDPNEPFARLVASWAAMFEKDLDRAKSEVDIALSLNPNFSGAYASLGSIHIYSGQPLQAIPALERASRLDPAFRPGHLHFLSMAYLLAGKYDTAVALLEERIRLMPGTDFSRVLLASALGHLGGDRNRLIVLLSFKAGLRAKEIASLKWSMVMSADGKIGDHIHLTNEASKGKSGRIIALNKELKKQLIKVKEINGIDRADSGRFVIQTRQQGTTAQVIVNSFAQWYRNLGFVGCSSHSGRRSFITQAARKASLVGGSLRDVQVLAGHASLTTTSRYIATDAEAQQKLVDII